MFNDKEMQENESGNYIFKIELSRAIYMTVSNLRDELLNFVFVWNHSVFNFV